MSGADTTAVQARQLLPSATEILEQVFDAMPIVSIGWLQQVSRHIHTAAKDRRSLVLKRRGLETFWSWQTAHAAETALFFDKLGSPGLWTPGPNSNRSTATMGNVIETGSDDGSLGENSGPWLWLSGGTDWQGFQGGFREIADVGIRPTWLSFRVRIQTTQLSGAFLTLAAAQRTWGLEDIVLDFQYSGDERLQKRRCFVVQSGATQHGDSSHLIRLQPEIVADRPYLVAVSFDWESAVMSVFVDGVQHLDRVPFKAERAVKFVAISNWRSGARTAFSELMLGCSCPYATGSSGAESSRSYLAKLASKTCGKRCSLPPKPAGSRVLGVSIWGILNKPFHPGSSPIFLGVALALLIAALVQQVVAIWPATMQR